jgi:hypothetical protein
VLTRAADPPPTTDHESFIDSLIQRHAVQLGGAFEGDPLPGVNAAYVLRCASLDEAWAIVAQDPLVTSGAATAAVVRWNVVGIDLAAIDSELAIGAPRA